jgi:hypothetical protein
LIEENVLDVEAAGRVDVGNTEMLEHPAVLVGRSQDYAEGHTPGGGLT